jgi:hypothetical protein
MASIAVTGAMKTTPGAALKVLLNWTPLHLKVEEVATFSAYRLAASGLWVNHFKLSRHTELNRKLGKNSSFWRNSDKMKANFVFNHAFSVIIDKREELKLDLYEESRDKILAFTDGSKSDEGTGSGILVAELDIVLSVNVGKDATVFQSEVKAIEICAKELFDKGVEGRAIHICSDSQAALMALKSNKISSRTT